MQHLTQEMASIRLLDLRHALWGAQRHNTPASVPTVWPQIDDIIGGFDDIKVVLDDEHGVATVHQAGQNLEAHPKCTGCVPCRAGSARG